MNLKQKHRVAIVLLAVAASIGGCPGVFQPADTSDFEITASAPGVLAAREAATMSASASAGGAAMTDVEYRWVQLSGAGVEIIDRYTSTATFVAPSTPENEMLRFMVIATARSGAVKQAELEIAVQRDANYGADPDGAEVVSPPTASAGLDQEVNAGEEVTLSASGSTGLGLRYAWAEINGDRIELASPTRVRTTFTAPDYEAGADNTYSFEVTVTDARGRTASDEVSVTVLETTDPNDGGPEPGDNPRTKPQVRFRTSLGNFTVELEPDLAPLSVANFLQYVDDDFYRNTVFHRVIPDFVVQGGGFTTDLTRKETRDAIALEADNGLRNDRGTLAMARTDVPDSATSQFYVNLVDNDSLNATDTFPGYTVFGRVVEGMDVIDAIADVQTGTVDGLQDVPLEDVVVLSATRVDR